MDRLPTVGEVELALKSELEIWMSLPYGELPGSVAEEIFARAVGGQRQKSMKLFDVVREHTGWSLKTKIVPGLTIGKHFAVVLARLHPKVTHLSAEEAGALLLADWHQFFTECLVRQGVNDPRTCLIATHKTNCVFFQRPFEIPASLRWEWTDSTRKGIQGWDGDQLIYRWFPRNGQLMGEYDVPSNASVVNMESKTWTVTELQRFHSELIPGTLF